jgi:hypothetical protein
VPENGVIFLKIVGIRKNLMPQFSAMISWSQKIVGRIKREWVKKPPHRVIQTMTALRKAADWWDKKQCQEFFFKNRILVKAIRSDITYPA